MSEAQRKTHAMGLLASRAVNGLPNFRIALLYAVERGYHVTDDGQLYGPHGLIHPLMCKGYPAFTANMPDKFRRRVMVHRLTAYQKYGEKMFEPGMEVRHRDGNKLNFRPDNILIGTRRDNVGDIPPDARKLMARKAVASRGRVIAERVRLAVELRNAGATWTQINRTFGLGPQGMQKALKRRGIAA